MGGRWDAWAPNAFLEQSGPAEPADILTASYCRIQVSAGFYPGQFRPTIRQTGFSMPSMALRTGEGRVILSRFSDLIAQGSLGAAASTWGPLDLFPTAGLQLEQQAELRGVI